MEADNSSVSTNFLLIFQKLPPMSARRRVYVYQLYRGIFLSTNLTWNDDVFRLYCNDTFFKVVYAISNKVALSKFLKNVHVNKLFYLLNEIEVIFCHLLGALPTRLSQFSLRGTLRT